MARALERRKRITRTRAAFFQPPGGRRRPANSGECRPAQLGPLPVVRGGDPGWNRRAEETRLFADKMRDASLKRELMAIAELYDKLAAAGSASRASPSIDAMAA